MFPTVLHNPGCAFRTASMEPSADASRRGRLSPAICQNYTHVIYISNDRTDTFTFDSSRYNTFEILWVNDCPSVRIGSIEGKIEFGRMFVRHVCIIFTCILTLAVSNGNVAKSAMQAAVPAESNFIHMGNSSDEACCFILCSFFLFSFSVSPPMFLSFFSFSQRFSYLV